MQIAVLLRVFFLLDANQLSDELSASIMYMKHMADPSIAPDR